ncbi:unnamed protein product, partial [Amoebophrya sp. A25]
VRSLASALLLLDVICASNGVKVNVLGKLLTTRADHQQRESSSVESETRAAGAPIP